MFAAVNQRVTNHFINNIKYWRGQTRRVVVIVVEGIRHQARSAHGSMVKGRGGARPGKKIRLFDLKSILKLVLCLLQTQTHKKVKKKYSQGLVWRRSIE